MDLDANVLKEISGVLSNIMVIVGIPIGIGRYWVATRKERREREHRVYDELDNKYIEFQRLCVRYPKLNVADVEQSAPYELNPYEQRQELQLFFILGARIVVKPGGLADHYGTRIS